MAAKKKVTKKAPAKKAAKKAPAKKAATTGPPKNSAKKSPAKKAAAATPAPKKAPAKKPAVKKAPETVPEAVPEATPETAPVDAVSVDAVSAEQEAAPKAPAAKTKTVAAKNAPAAKAAPILTPEQALIQRLLPKKKAKMTAFVLKQRQNLLDLRDELMDAMYGVQQEALRNTPEGSEASGSGMHQGDAGSDAYDRDFALSLLSKEQDALAEIKAALQRIEAGYYGICEMSGKKIPHPRLEAIPFARLTVECQTRWEKEFPHRQFRTEDAIAIAAGILPTGMVSLDEMVR